MNCRYRISSDGVGWGLNLDDVAKYMRTNDLGVIGFQEGEASHPLLGQRDIPHYLATATDSHYYYGLNPLLSSFDGCPILSPFPLYDCAAHRLATTAVLPAFAYTECEVCFASCSLDVL